MNAKSQSTFIRLAATLTHIQLLMMAGGLFGLTFKYALDWSPDWEWVNERFGFEKAVVWEITRRLVFILLPTAFFFPFIRLIAARFVKSERRFKVAVVGLTSCTAIHFVVVIMAWMCDGLIPSRYHQREIISVVLWWPLESIFSIWLFTGIAFQLTTVLASIFHSFFLWGKFKTPQWCLWLYTGAYFYWLVRLLMDPYTGLKNLREWNILALSPAWLPVGLVFLPAVLTPISIGVAFYRKYRKRQ
jgi:hypothetical protein